MSESHLLDAETIGRARSLGLAARTIVEGLHAGENRSPYHGFSVEFADHRAYTPGDDLRRVDWKVLGRTDRFFVKRFQQETTCTVTLVVDSSASMDYGQGEQQKILSTQKLAAAMAWLVLDQRDAVALRSFDSSSRVRVARAASPGSIDEVLHALASIAPHGTTDVASAIDQAVAESRRRGIIVLLSDLLDDEDRIITSVRRARAAGHEVLMFHTMHHDELTLDLQSPTIFESLEDNQTLTISPHEIRRSYVEAVEAFCQTIRQGCESARCHYVLHDTSRRLADVLGEYLAFRAHARV
jgi:uncharacterized protein (DUF58 family)